MDIIYSKCYNGVIIVPRVADVATKTVDDTASIRKDGTERRLLVRRERVIRHRDRIRNVYYHFVAAAGINTVTALAEPPALFKFLRVCGDHTYQKVAGTTYQEVAKDRA